MSQLFATKPLDAIAGETEGDASLRRVLGPGNLVALGIGAVIGAGIFVITGSAAARYAGPAISLSFILAGLGCALAGLCYAEFATLIPVAGSAYTYGYATLGEIFAWIIGWDLILEYAVSAATVASGWSANVVSLLQDFGIHLPPRFTDTPGTVLVFFQNRWEPLASLGPSLASAGIDPSSLPTVAAVFNLPAPRCSVARFSSWASEPASHSPSFVKVGTVLTSSWSRAYLSRPEVAPRTDAVSSAERGLRGFRSLGNRPRRRRDLFRLRRLRRGLDGGPGGAKSPAGHALRASRSLDLHRLYIAVAAILTGRPPLELTSPPPGWASTRPACLGSSW
jgi:hypothetical protein